MTVTGTPGGGGSLRSSPTAWIHHSFGISGSPELRCVNWTTRRSGSTRASRRSRRRAETTLETVAAGTRQTSSGIETGLAWAARNSGESAPPGAVSCTSAAWPGRCGTACVRGCAKPAATALGANAKAARMTPMVSRRPFKRRKQSTNVAYIGLGANLGEREATIRAAVDELALRPDIELIRVSSLRETHPVGIEDQPRFLNGVAMVETTLGAVELLAALLTIERKLGRDRTASTPGGPRPIDLDLLLYGNATIDEAGLQVPHPRLHERRFALEPLAEIAPGLVIPGRGQVSALLAELE